MAASYQFMRDDTYQKHLQNVQVKDQVIKGYYYEDSISCDIEEDEDKENK